MQSWVKAGGGANPTSAKHDDCYKHFARASIVSVVTRSRQSDVKTRPATVKLKLDCTGDESQPFGPLAIGNPGAFPRARHIYCGSSGVSLLPMDLRLLNLAVQGHGGSNPTSGLIVEVRIGFLGDWQPSTTARS